MFGFTQGTTTGNPFWDKVRDFLSEPTPEEIGKSTYVRVFIYIYTSPPLYTYMFTSSYIHSYIFLTLILFTLLACQSPKPILLNTGDLDVPHAWDPSTLPMQIFRVGQLFIVSVPSEFTTMSGRRMRKALYDIVRASGVVSADEEIYITIAGLANGYSSYVTTYEEFQAQRYEGKITFTYRCE